MTATYSNIFSYVQENDEFANLNGDAIPIIPKKSDYDSNISIVSNTELSEWCAGNDSQDGLSWESAYILQNYNISFEYSFNVGLIINNTNLYLILRNITITNINPIFVTIGLYVEGASHIKIENCSFMNHFVSVSVDLSTDIYFENNIYNSSINIWNSNEISIFNDYAAEGSETSTVYLNNNTNTKVISNIFNLPVEFDQNSNSIIAKNQFLRTIDLNTESHCNFVNNIVESTRFYGYNSTGFVSCNEFFSTNITLHENRDLYFAHNNITDLSDQEKGIEIYYNPVLYIYENFIKGFDFGIYFDIFAAKQPNATVWNNIFSENLSPMHIESLQPTLYKNSIGNYWDDYTTKYPAASELGYYYSIPYQPNLAISQYDNYPLVAMPDFMANYSLSSPSVLVADYFASQNLINFNVEAIAYYNLSYSLKQGETLLDSGLIENKEFTIDLHNFGAGLQEFTIIIYNEAQFALSQRSFNFSIMFQGYPPSKPIWITENFATREYQFQIEWNTVEFATAYIIYVNGEYYQKTTSTSYTVVLSESGTYTINIAAENDFGLSDLSDTLQISIIESEEDDSSPTNSDTPLIIGVISAFGVGVILTGTTIKLRQKKPKIKTES